MSGPRTARVLLAGQAVDLVGPAADLVALVACTAVSPRTLRLLVHLAAREAHLAPLADARLEVVLDGGGFRCYVVSRPRFLDAAGPATTEATDVA